jgi:putative addiction module killer protein
VEAIPKLILMYETEDGKVPVSDWLDALRLRDEKTYDRIINFVDRVESGSTSNFKPEGEGVTALIMDFGPGYRIYFGQDGRDLIILLIGGDKKKQDEDIATAKQYWRDYNA